MTDRTATVASRVGLHARPASIFARAAAQAGVTVTLTAADGRAVNAASILGVLSLGIDHGQTVTLTAEGPEAERVLDELAALLERELDED